MENKITTNIKFEEYEFRRVKPMGKNAVIYMDTEWIGKDVCIIPVPLDITDRWIEKQWDGVENHYDITIPTYLIFHKKIKNGNTVGRCYMPNDLIGLDCLVIESPKLDNF